MARQAIRAAVIGTAMGVLSCAAMFASSPAHADLRLCNKTRSDVLVAVSYVDPHDNGFTSEGWWTLRAGGHCETLIFNNVTSDPHNYFYYAKEKNGDGRWTGDSVRCTDREPFTITGPADGNWCSNVGFNARSFIHVHSPAGNITVDLTSRDGGQIIDDNQ